MQREKINFVGYDLPETYGGTVLRCPQRGSGYMHMLSVSVLRETDKTTVSSKGILIEKAKNPGRGAVVTLEYHCEGEFCHGELTFTFYKGNINIEHKPLPELKPEEYEDIWRD